MKSSLKPTGNHLFRFVVIADTHINQSEDKASSFFELNRLANARARRAFHEAKRYDPSFVVHLGDIVHPIPSHAGFHEAAENYRQMAATLDCPIYLTPGNHDVGDKPWPLAPVAQIAPDFMRAYEQEFGAQWFEWQHQDCNFLVLNTSLLNSGLPEELAQQRWFERALAEAKGRTFVSLHYPPYVRDADEPSHYDNIDEPARSWLLDLLVQHHVEAVFCGHVHNLWYDQYGSTEIYLLPSTAFVRQDYSEMQRCLPPGAEGGRQDVDKLGFFVIDIFETGHVARFIRSESNDLANECNERQTGPVLHSKCPLLPNLGIDPGYPWASDVEIQPSGALDAFDTKTVRNDYPLYSFFDLGISRMRMAMSDLRRPEAVVRLQKLARTGMRAQLVATSLPDVEQVEVMRELAPAIECLEFVAPASSLRAEFQKVAKIIERLPGVRLVISKLRQPSDAAVDGLTYGHLVFHGWVPAEISQLRELSKLGYAGTSALFRVGFSDSPLEVAEQVCQLPETLGMQAGMLVRIATDNPAEAQTNEVALCAQLVESALAAYRHPSLSVTVEGMVDFDRGYFLRVGMFDRSFNPRVGGLVLKHWISMLAQEEPSIDRIERARNDRVYSLRLTGPKGCSELLIFDADMHGLGRQVLGEALEAGKACWNLRSGERIRSHAIPMAQNLVSAIYIGA
ncbi:metallophosphoesterase family protein [Cupriavidus oxalaticus]|nr:metallophosphoesterase [Cupriavidus oxalaticus]